MAGGSGSRNSTPPVGHPSSTPTPPQVYIMHNSSHFLTHLLAYMSGILKHLEHLIKMREVASHVALHYVCVTDWK